ncbi:YggT family protein [Anaerovorax sp. IOR16]|uniref:YggT family protein n=1 Tax=Anaerovorax sp. IOR16 TaxID=2773458 RepID=UPI0019D06090|nr:YggT family protein [Anaerovorax sp. IOR16]
MTYVLARAISFFIEIVITLIVVEALMSWFVRPGSNFYRIYCSLHGLTEPIVNPFRQLTSGLAYRTGIDFSPLVAIIALQLLESVLYKLLLLF